MTTVFCLPLTIFTLYSKFHTRAIYILTTSIQRPILSSRQSPLITLHHLDQLHNIHLILSSKFRALKTNMSKFHFLTSYCFLKWKFDSQPVHAVFQPRYARAIMADSRTKPNHKSNLHKFQHIFQLDTIEFISIKLLYPCIYYYPLKCP